MAQENQGPSSATPESLPAKRKRGRPRKDGTEIGTPRVPKVSTPTFTPTPTPAPRPIPPPPPAPVTVQRSQRRKTDPRSETGDESLIGEQVKGVLDGTFDAGYLLTVRVGDTETILRGVVFRPGMAVPVTGANDLAPNLNMLRRADVPIPMGIPPTQVQGSTSQSTQNDARPVVHPLKNLNQVPQPVMIPAPQPVSQAPIVAPQVSLPQVQTSSVTSKGEQNETKHVPETVIHALQPSESQTKNDADIPVGGHSGGENSKPNNPTPSVTPINAMPLPVPSAQDHRDASKGMELELRTPSVEISLNHVPPGEDKGVGSKGQPDGAFALMFQTAKEQAPLTGASGSNTVATETGEGERSENDVQSKQGTDQKEETQKKDATPDLLFNSVAADQPLLPKSNNADSAGDSGKVLN